MQRIKNTNRVFLKRTSDAYHNHKRRAEKCRTLLGYTLKDLRELVSASLGDGCPYCGTTLSPASFQLDHKDPVSRGGYHSIKNLAVCCRPCNEAKGVLSGEEFSELLSLTRSWLPRIRQDLLGRLRAGGRRTRRT
jgi:5-methylcytosine-specific restriction endonuclease McrA